MRFRISLYPEKARFELPYNYNYPLASAIYSFLGIGDASLSDFLHDEGFHHDGKVFKLFTFSPLFCSQRKALKDGLIIKIGYEAGFGMVEEPAKPPQCIQKCHSEESK